MPIANSGARGMQRRRFRTMPARWALSEPRAGHRWGNHDPAVSAVNLPTSFPAGMVKYGARGVQCRKVTLRASVRYRDNMFPPEARISHLDR